MKIKFTVFLIQVFVMLCLSMSDATKLKHIVAVHNNINCNSFSYYNIITIVLVLNLRNTAYACHL